VAKPNFPHDPPAFVFNVDGSRMLMCSMQGRARLLKAVSIED
jgi:hypothetical protein